MNQPLLPSPRFQSPPMQKNAKCILIICSTLNDYFLVLTNYSLLSTATQNRSPVKNHNGRDNTESIDMEMSDEDFDTIPEFQSNHMLYER